MRQDIPRPRQRGAHGRFVPDDVLRQIREVEAKLKHDMTRPSGALTELLVLHPAAHAVGQPGLKTALDPQDPSSRSS